MLGKARFTIGFIVGSIVFGSSAFAATTILATNTPSGGYLLCFNSKTKAVTYPGALSCPTGTKPLDLGASKGKDGVDGIPGLRGLQGIQGPKGDTGARGMTGPQGPSGSSSSVIQFKLLESKDIVVDEEISSLSDGKKVIMGTFSAKDFGLGAFQLQAYLEGLWSDSALDKQPIVKCFFQRKNDFDAAGESELGSYIYGAAETQYNTWNAVTLTVNGDDWWTANSDDPTYLVCVFTGSVKGLDGLVKAFPYSSINQTGKAN
jgi:hypothetical protein